MSGVALSVIGILLIAVFGLAVLGLFIFWIAMLFDVVRNRRHSPEVKLIWFVVVFFLHFVGAIIYYFAGRAPARFS